MMLRRNSFAFSSLATGNYIRCHKLPQRRLSCVSRKTHRNGTCVMTTQAKRSLSQSCQNLNSAFAKQASGEWFGYEVSFSPKTGAALDIGEWYVPDEYRQWGVALKGFDIVTSTNVTSNLLLKRTRALPSVGCEADAVVPEVAVAEHECAFGFGDGSFSAGPMTLSENLLWSFAIRDPNERHSRARIEFGRVDLGESDITVFIEKREGDFCDGQVLPGCGGSGDFSSGKLFCREDLQGTWSSFSEVCKAENDWASVTEQADFERRNASDLISTALPHGLSVEVCEIKSRLHTAVGWMKGNTRVVIRRSYDDKGALASVSHRTETRQK